MHTVVPYFLCPKTFFIFSAIPTENYIVTDFGFLLPHDYLGVCRISVSGFAKSVLENKNLCLFFPISLLSHAVPVIFVTEAAYDLQAFFGVVYGY